MYILTTTPSCTHTQRHPNMFILVHPHILACGQTSINTRIFIPTPIYPDLHISTHRLPAKTHSEDTKTTTTTTTSTTTKTTSHDDDDLHDQHDDHNDHATTRNTTTIAKGRTNLKLVPPRSPTVYTDKPTVSLWGSTPPAFATSLLSSSYLVRGQPNKTQ